MKTTRSSLLLALKEDGSDPLWAEFFHLYSPLITHTAKRSGLSNSDSDDIVQDVLLQIVSSIDSYTYDRNRGLFRAWLKTVTIHKIRDMQRRNKKRAQGVPSLDHIASPDDLELRWDDAFRRQLVQFALRKIRKEFRPRTWQCFVCHGLQRRPAAIVAQESGVTENAVYINTTRVMKRLREICAEHQTNPNMGSSQAKP